MEEIWKDVVGFEGLYQVSDLGNVRNYEKTIWNGRHMPQIILATRVCKTGYVDVHLCSNGKHHAKRLHRLVAQAFLPNENDFPEINHKDEDKTNNSLANLEWCNSHYNVNYGTCIKRRSENHKKQIIQKDLSGNFIKSWNGFITVERELGIWASCVRQCCMGRNKTAGGYCWEYANQC